MEQGVFSRAGRAFLVFVRWPFLYLFFLLTRRKVKLRFFKPDSLYAIENLPVDLRWLVRHALRVHLSGYGYVLRHRSHHLVAAGKDGDRFMLTAWGIQGKVQQEIRLKVVKVKPVRLAARFASAPSSPRLSSVSRVRVRNSFPPGIKHAATGLWGGQEQEEALREKLEALYQSENKNDLKKINV